MTIQQQTISDSAGCGAVMFAASFGKLGLEFRIIRQPLGNCLLEAYRLADGRIAAQVLRTRTEAREIMWQLTSRPIRTSEETIFILSFIWSRDGFRIGVNGKDVADSNWASPSFESFVVSHRFSAPKAEDLSALNAVALANRREKFCKQRKWPNRRPMGAEFDFDRLRKELAALNDFLGLISRGSTYHDLSVAKSLRTLLVPVRGQMGLLQRCAAHLDAPIVVFTGTTPSSRPPIAVALALDVAISGVALWPHSNPVDVDVWLNLPAANLRGREYSNGDLIAAIGDTRAAHADPGWEPLVEALETMQICGASPMEHNMLTASMVRIAHAMILVSRLLLIEQRKAA